jgi:acetyl-CoA synthetase
VQDVVWSPSPEYIERANVTRFMRAHGIATYEELVARSVGDISWFWDAVVRDLGISFLTPYEQVLDTSRGVEWATWFTGGKTNLAHQCLDVWAHRTPEAVAVVWEAEDGDVRRVTYRALRELTDRLAHGLRSLGVQQRDTVGIFMPMAVETVAALLACSKIGAIWVPIFSGFGPEAVAARLADANVSMLITADGSLRRGQPVPMKAIADRAADEAGGIRHTLVWNRLDDADSPWNDERDVRWEDLVAAQPARFDTELLDSEHPLFIGYTSGTTGRPKGVLHVHAGFLVKVAEEVAYQTDVRPGDVLHWVTDLGWIMGPWEIVGALALGSTVLLTEGAPNHPGPDRLWATVERHGVTMLGVSPTLIRALIPSGTEPVRSHDLSTLRILASTGEPWNPEPYRWLMEEVGGGRCPIINLSGGTEVGACFLSPLPITELKACTLRGPALGMDVDVWGPDGAPVARGQVGELVCKQPWPAMTRGVWGDDEPRCVLAPLPGRVGARRLGDDRRRRVLVPARAVRRHAEHRGQAAGSGRSRERARVAPGGRGVGRRGRSARGQGRDGLVLRRPEAGHRTDRRHRRGAPLGRGAAPRQAVRAVEGGVRGRAAEDAEREDRSPRDPRPRRRRGSRRSVEPGEPELARRDP